MKKRKVLVASLLIASVLAGHLSISKEDVSAATAAKFEKAAKQPYSNSANLNVKSTEGNYKSLNTADGKYNIYKKKANKKKKKSGKKKRGSGKLVNGMRTKFKKAMDSYEEFYDEYCKILKKYNDNPTDIAILTEYTKLLEKQIKVNENFEKWDGNLNNAELKYYLKVHSRILKKLADIN